MRCHFNYCSAFSWTNNYRRPLHARHCLPLYIKTYNLVEGKDPKKLNGYGNNLQTVNNHNKGNIQEVETENRRISNMEIRKDFLGRWALEADSNSGTSLFPMLARALGKALGCESVWRTKKITRVGGHKWEKLAQNQRRKKSRCWP